MRKIIITLASILVSVNICHAQALKAGAHLGYTVNGDIDKKSATYGVQAELKLNDNIGIELAYTGFKDDADVGDTKTQTIGLTGKLGTKLVENIGVYAGAGVNYNMFDASMDLTSAQIAALAGTSLADGISVDMDNKVGAHLCAGLTMAICKNIELFGEYRYTFVKAQGEVQVSSSTLHESAKLSEIDENYNFGMIKIGANFVF